MSGPRREWHIVTCEYPPQVGGVADYTAQVATGLSRAGERVHVWCPGAGGHDTSGDGVMIHRELGAFTPADCAHVGALMNQHGPRRLLVQWVPHGYGYKSLNVPFAAWLAWRAWVRGDDLQLMVHEPYMRVSWPPAHLVASLVERFMLWLVGTASSRTWLSTPSWAPYVKPYVRRDTTVEWLPVPAPIAVATPVPHDEERRAAPRVVGHFSTHSPVVTALLAPALEQLLTTSTAEVLLIGRDSDRFRARLIARRPALAERVRATGVLDAAQVVARMRQCDLMLQPYPDGITTRNTSMLLALAAGVCVASNTGPLTEPFWSSSPAVALAPGLDPAALAELTLALLSDPVRRERIGAAGAQLYVDQFDIAHAVAMLTASAQADSPSAPRARHAEA